MGSRVTIYDIAKKVGVSPATVSRVLNGSKHPVKVELREFILKAAKEMGYIPNLQARSLKQQTTRSIGVIIPSIANPFYPSIVRGIEDEVVSHDYHMVVFSCDRKKKRINYSIETMQAVNMQGIISIYMEDIPESLARFVKNGGIALNVVANDKSADGMYTIIVDKVAECKLAMDYLINMGHKKIAILMDKEDNSIRTARLETYRKTLRAAKIKADKKRIYIFGEDVPESDCDSSQKGLLLAKKMLQRTPDVTAFVCMNDVMALGALKALRECKKKVPEDYSMISFDDLFFSDMTNPELTTVGLDQYEWGRNLAKYYFKITNDSENCNFVIDEKKVLNAPNLIVRQSVRPLREK